MKTFEDYLRDIHSKNYMGTDDDMSDKFDLWLERLDIDEWISHGNGFGIYVLQETKKILLK